MILNTSIKVIDKNNYALFKNEIPTFLTLDRLILLSRHGVKLVSFGSKNCCNLPKNSFEISFFENSIPGLLENEKSRTGWCLMSLECVTGSTGKNFITQFSSIRNFVSNLIPEVLKTSIWKQSCREFYLIEDQLVKLAEENRDKELVMLLSSIKIFQNFIPKSIELIQLITFFKKIKKKILYNDFYSSSSTINPNRNSFIDIGLFTNKLFFLGNNKPDVCWDKRGCCFICSLEDLFV